MIKTPWPRFVDTPFKKVKLPIEMQYDIKTAYNMCRFNRVVYAENVWGDDYQAFVADGTVGLLNSNKPFCLVSDVPTEWFLRWEKVLRPIAEEWCGIELEFVNAYGVRSYVRDSILNVHRDNPRTHVISAIIFVDEYPGKIQWPLDFVDHNKSVFLKNNLFFLEVLHFPSYNLVKKIHNFLQTLPQQKKLQQSILEIT